MHEINGDATVLRLSVRLLGFPFFLYIFTSGISLLLNGVS